MEILELISRQFMFIIVCIFAILLTVVAMCLAPFIFSETVRNILKSTADFIDFLFLDFLGNS
jgi:hypothetical protein